MKHEESPYICPAEFSGSLDNAFRRWLHNPRKILGPYIKRGMTVLDLGCGPGVFTIELAKLVQATGKVIAADVQDGMLQIVADKIKGTDAEQIVELHKCQSNSIGLTQKVDFILSFWMVHEVPDHNRLFEEFKTVLKPDGEIFIIEPKIHVPAAAFERMTEKLINAGFEIGARPGVFFSRALLLKKRR